MFLGHRTYGNSQLAQETMIFGQAGVTFLFGMMGFIAQLPQEILLKTPRAVSKTLSRNRTQTFLHSLYKHPPVTTLSPYHAEFLVLHIADFGFCGFVEMFEQVSPVLISFLTRRAYINESVATDYTAVPVQIMRCLVGL